MSVERKAPPKQEVMVVDDTPASLHLLARILSAEGYTVRPARSGRVAVASALNDPPDLILLDVTMPEMDGFQACARFKADERTRLIPVIFVSARDESEAVVKGFSVGGVDYITKPFRSSEVLARVRTHLALRSLQELLEAQNVRLQQEIREREQVEGELRRHKIHLEELVAESTADLRTINEELRLEIEERKRLATAIEQAAEGIVVADIEGIIRYVNPAFERMTGYHRSEIIGRSVHDFNGDEREEPFCQETRDALRQGVTWSGRARNRRRDGTPYETEVAISPVRDESGAIIDYVSIHRDITHEVRLESELRQAQKMEAIGTLAGGIAHDFNNILMAICGYTEMAMQRFPEGSPGRRNLDQVLTASHRAADLVSQILAFSRQAEHERKPVNIVPLVKETLKLLRSSLPSTIEIRQEISIAEKGGIILADPTQVHQVLMNLCTNSAHAMRAKGGVLTVKLSNIVVDSAAVSRHPRLKPGAHVCLTVSDTGHGVAPAILERIFDPYFTTKEPGKGTGLGLAVVQGIVKSYGGAISVYSELGLGTSFDVFIPRTGEEIAADSMAAEPLPGGTERILFVDDEGSLVELGKDMLESLGYAVTTRTSGVEARETFRAAPEAFDLVITDMTMPTVTGMDLAGEILAVRPHLPIILCTGFSEMIDGRQAKEAGIREFVMKPYQLAILARAVRKALDE